MTIAAAILPYPVQNYRLSRNKHYYYSAESPSENIQTTAVERLHPCRDCSSLAMPFPRTTSIEYLYSY